jgi:hypothetical protein
MASVNCYVYGTECYVKDSVAGTLLDNRYVKVTDTVWDAINEMIGGNAVKSDWNLTAFHCGGGYSVFTYVDRTTRYKFFLMEDKGGDSRTVVSYSGGGEVVNDGRVQNGNLELSRGGRFGNDKSSWENNTGRVVVLSVRKMVPNPIFHGGPYWMVYNSDGHVVNNGMSNDTSEISPEDCRNGDRYTVVLEPGEAIDFIGPGDVEKNGAESHWRVTYGQRTETSIIPTRICTQLIDDTWVECIYDQEVIVNDDTCETKRVPIVWRTIGLAGSYTDGEGVEHQRGEYVFLDPFASNDVYAPIPGPSRYSAGLDKETGRIYFNGSNGIDDSQLLQNTHAQVHVPRRWRTELLGALQPPDPDMPATENINKSVEIDTKKANEAYDHRKLTEQQFKRIYMTNARRFAQYYDHENKAVTMPDYFRLEDGYLSLTYEKAWEEHELLQLLPILNDRLEENGQNPYTYNGGKWDDLELLTLLEKLKESGVEVPSPNEGAPDFVTVDGLEAAYEDGVASQLVGRFCGDFTGGDLVMGQLPLLWFKKFHDERTATVVLKDTQVVNTNTYACAGVSQFGNGIALMCLEHVHNDDPMMVEHGHLQVFVFEPRQETWSIEHTSFSYGGGAGVSGLMGSSRTPNHFSTGNHHYTHATLSPYLPNVFGTPDVGDKPDLLAYEGVAMETNQERVKPTLLDTAQALTGGERGNSTIGRYLAVKPSYGLLFVYTGEDNPTADCMECEEKRPTERPFSDHADMNKLWRIGNMESPVAYDHAGHWRELWADLGVQSGAPLSGGIMPWNGLPAGYQCFGGQTGSRPWTMEARRIEDSLKHSQFDFVPSKPLITKSRGVVGSNGMLICFSNVGGAVMYNIENFGPDLTYGDGQAPCVMPKSIATVYDPPM